MRNVGYARALACVGVTMGAALQAARETNPQALAPALVSAVLLAAILSGRRDAQRSMAAVALALCAVAAARWSVPLSFAWSAGISVHVTPAVALLAVALVFEFSARRGRGIGIGKMLPCAALTGMAAGIFGFACLAPLYALDGGILRGIVLNGGLIAGAWSLLWGRREVRGSAALVCGGTAVWALAAALKGAVS